MSEAPKEVKLKRCSEIEVSKDPDRIPTGIAGLDACLAESDEGPQGLPVGTSVLLSGMPGGGKSTIATFIAAAKTGRESLIMHGEERAERVRRRFDRLGIKLDEVDPFLHPLKAGEEALEVIRDVSAGKGLGVGVIDSIQTLSWGGKMKYDAQYEASEAIVGQITSAGGIALLVSHVSKSGNDHAGAAALAHLVDIHLHLTTNAKKSLRVLEVRKNRMGRAGFQVPLNITAVGMSVGVPAPLNVGADGMAVARTALDKASEYAYETILKGERLDFYDFDKPTPPVSGGLWRAALEMAAKRLVRDGFSVLDEKVKGRRGFQLELKDGVPVMTKVVEKVVDVQSGLPIKPNGESMDILPIELD
jgi:hypothetical protein